MYFGSPVSMSQKKSSKSVEVIKLGTGAFAALRRIIFFTAVVTLTAIASTFMADILWQHGMQVTEWVLLLIYIFLFGNISFGFCQSVTGFIMRTLSLKDPKITDTLNESNLHVPLGKTAIVLPVCDEEVRRVYEGLRAIYKSLEMTGHLDDFHFFILSDSRKPKQWIEEEAGWVELCKQLGAFGRIFYRKRRTNINRKSGNLSDFCRRWGKSYSYMLTLDADSVMSGETIVKLVRLMEVNQGVGLIQTVPYLIRGETLFGRLQQFSNTLYGRLFTIGLNFWQLAESNYWGHNAIIRLAPFIEHCSLPELPGKEPFGGKILSHDYVEAALMRRGGWEVWMAYDLPGSWEEGPPNLVEFAKRDRRWCQGNLQHSWLLFARGLFAVNRLHLGLGILSYVSSFLWSMFLILSVIIVYDFSQSGLTYIPSVGFAEIWKSENISEPLALFLFTLFILFLPKVLSVVDVVRQPELARLFGGRSKVVMSALLESVYSVFQAPIMMLFHAKFVVLTFLGSSSGWAAQTRDAGDGLSWWHAIRVHLGHIFTGLLCAILCWWIDYRFFLWMGPIWAGMLLSVPLSVYGSRSRLGDWVTKWRLFRTPQDINPPAELEELNNRMRQQAGITHLPIGLAEDHGLTKVLIDPYMNGVHVYLLRKKGGASGKDTVFFNDLRARLLIDGPDALSEKEQLTILRDAESMSYLHRQLWIRSSTHLHYWWNLALREYNLHTKKPFSELTEMSN